MTKPTLRACQCLFVGLFASVPKSEAQVTFPNFRIVIVGPVAGDPAASGTRLVNAMNGINPTSCPGDYWLLRIMPGVYDLGSSALVMKPCVDVEGSGEDATVVAGGGFPDTGPDPGTGTVVAAPNAELRLLTVLNTGGDSRAVALYANVAGGLRVRQATLRATNASFRSHGAFITDSSVTLDSVTILAAGGLTTLATHAISLGGAGASSIMNSSIVAAGGATTRGIENSGASLTIRDTVVSVSGGFNNNFGVTRAAATIEMANVRIEATGAGSYGVFAQTSVVMVDSSMIRGDGNTVFSLAPIFPVRIGASKMAGGPVSGPNIVCAGVYDENYAFYPSTCPS